MCDSHVSGMCTRTVSHAHPHAQYTRSHSHRPPTCSHTELRHAPTPPSDALRACRTLLPSPQQGLWPGGAPPPHTQGSCYLRPPSPALHGTEQRQATEDDEGETPGHRGLRPGFRHGSEGLCDKDTALPRPPLLEPQHCPLSPPVLVTHLQMAPRSARPQGSGPPGALQGEETPQTGLTPTAALDWALLNKGMCGQWGTVWGPSRLCGTQWHRN